MKIGIVAKTKAPEFAEQLPSILDFFSRKNCQVFFEKKIITDFRLDYLEGFSREELPRISDVLIVFGGDGTLLSVARLIGKESCPILGVNLGSLGFLTEVTLKELDVALTQLLEGDFQTSPRSLLEVNLVRKNGKTDQFRALNDVVINKGALARIINLEAYCDKKFIANFLADGVIIATQTGSTAYSLSAGGPIILPNQNLLILNPICPHTLTNRPLIIPSSSKIEINLKDGKEVTMTVDGQIGTTMLPGDQVHCRLSKNSIELIHSTSRNFFDVLRQKLKWAERL